MQMGSVVFLPLQTRGGQLLGDLGFGVCCDLFPSKRWAAGSALASPPGVPLGGRGVLEQNYWDFSP